MFKTAALWAVCSYALIALLFLFDKRVASIIIVIISGCIFSILLTYKKESPDNKLTLFILLSSIWYLFCLWLSLLFKHYFQAYLFAISIIGAIVLFVLYRVLINKRYLLQWGIVYMLAAGVSSAALQVIVITMLDSSHSDAIYLFSTSVIPVWQILFSLALDRSRINHYININVQI